MTDTEGEAGAPGRRTSEAFRTLPAGVALEDTVQSKPGATPFEPADDRNAFIETAVQAGG